LSDFVETDDDAFGEEFTNKIPTLRDDFNRSEAAMAAVRDVLISQGLQAFAAPKRKEFQGSRNGSSIMPAKLLSIMKGSRIRLTSLFKPIPNRLWQGLPIDREHNSGGEIKSREASNSDRWGPCPGIGQRIAARSPFTSGSFRGA
jgi:hypothetical protein